jgi:hypothetical protein
MSRSTKKVFGFKDSNPFMKTYANRRLRRIKIKDTLADGTSYRKYTCPWDISDWKYIYYTEVAFIAAKTSDWHQYPNFCKESNPRSLKHYIAMEKAYCLKK